MKKFLNPSLVIIFPNPPKALKTLLTEKSYLHLTSKIKSLQVLTNFNSSNKISVNKLSISKHNFVLINPLLL